MSEISKFKKLLAIRREGHPLPFKVFVFVVIVAVLFLLLNFQYFWANLTFTINKPEEQQLPVNEVIEPNILKIPGLGIQAPIRYVDVASEDVFQKALADGVVQFPGTAKPGEWGNAYIFGHSSDYAWSKGNYKTVFALLPRIQTGERITVSDASGKAFNYIVTKTFVVAPDNTEVLDQFGYQKKVLTLQTSYPVGTALKRFIVQAEIAAE
jgi:LPXTG-site transpeptidase (sortase) family protein